MVLAYDFDQTLCSSKHGKSPLASKTSPTLDEQLVEIALERYQRFGSPTYIVTRNFHKADIEAFLLGALGAQAGALFVVRSVTYEESTKVAVARELLASASASASTSATGAAPAHLVLVDDSVDELVLVERARACAGGDGGGDDGLRALGGDRDASWARSITCVLYSRTC